MMVQIASKSCCWHTQIIGFVTHYRFCAASILRWGTRTRLIAYRKTMSRSLVAWALGFSFFAGPAFAQTSKPTVVPSEPPKPQASTDIKVPLLAAGLHLSDFEGMQPRPELRNQLAEVKDFIQNTPHDGEAAVEKTEVWFGRTQSALYFVFICYDHRPAEIRGHLARRENIVMDDNVSVLLDPFQDRRKGVLFQVNPAGVQADAAWTENNNNGPDYSYDQVWDSEGRVTREGWMALIEIPFRSIRFREASSDWGVVFSRNFPRNSEVDYWPRVAANISGV